MKEAIRQTRTHLMELFEQHGFHPRHKLGQNFLIDLNIIDFVVAQARLDDNDVVLEIGSGTGGMTTFMAQQAGHVISVELDKNMFALASTQTAEFENVTLINEDALKNKNHFNPIVLETIERELQVSPKRRLKLIANLPYSVATPVVSNLVATELPWKRIVVTIQYELGKRMSAKPGSSNYGALSVWLQAQADVKLLKRLTPMVFWPRPKVNSAIVSLDPIPEKKEQIHDRPFFMDFVRRLFHQRRKFMRSVIVGMYRKQLEKSAVDEILTEMNFDENTRAEELEPETLVELSNRLNKRIETPSPPERGAG